jgi:hypothetical protein
MANVACALSTRGCPGLSRFYFPFGPLTRLASRSPDPDATIAEEVAEWLKHALYLIRP